VATLPKAGRALAAQRGHLLCWVPIFLALGIGGYFALAVEPGARAYGGAALGALALLGMARLVGEDWRPVFAALSLVLIGALLAGARANSVAQPVLGFRYYGPIQGRIVKVDRSASDAQRLTLDRVVLRRMAPAKTPARVRVSLHGDQGFIDLAPGLTVILTGNLSPPAGPAEPGGFDFQRMAWFDGLGAVGYTRTPVLGLAAAQPGGLALRLFRLRKTISDWVQDSMEGRAGAFAAAVMVGDRSSMDRGAIDDLRRSNLSHLLAISGLHMGLLTGFIFALIRYGMALLPGVALRWPVKKIAAVGALLAGAAYLALSGGNVATERAFVMVSVMFGAVLLGRRAVTLRAVAMAATIVLALRPEVLTEPGFQMSFSATVGLVAVFGALRNWRGWRLPRALRPVLAVVLSSAVAGLATAPFAAASFNRIADYGLLANLLSVPLMGLVVMPGAVLAALLAPVGLGWVGLAMMRPAINWILGVAHWIAGLEGAVTHVPTPPGAVLPVLALGALWLVLWQGRALVRLAGVVPVVLAFGIWAQAERPPILVSDSGGLIGVMTDTGRALNKPGGDGFAARSWLENDGDGADQGQAFARPGFAGIKGDLRADLGGVVVAHLSGRGTGARLAAACDTAALVVVSVKVVGAPRGCDVYDPLRLRDTGALAVLSDGGGVRIVSARAVAGRRLWSSRAMRRRGGRSMAALQLRP
jgi:competence protein ComEC